MNLKFIIPPANTTAPLYLSWDNSDSISQSFPINSTGSRLRVFSLVAAFLVWFPYCSPMFSATPQSIVSFKSWPEVCSGGTQTETFSTRRGPRKNILMVRFWNLPTRSQKSPHLWWWWEVAIMAGMLGFTCMNTLFHGGLGQKSLKRYLSH